MGIFIFLFSVFPKLFAFRKAKCVVVCIERCAATDFRAFFVRTNKHIYHCWPLQRPYINVAAFNLEQGQVRERRRWPSDRLPHPLYKTTNCRLFGVVLPQNHAVFFTLFCER